MAIKTAAVQVLTKLFVETFTVTRNVHGAKGLTTDSTFQITGRYENDQKLMPTADNKEILCVGFLSTFTKLLPDLDQLTIDGKEHFVHAVNENKDETGAIVFYECYLRRVNT